ncbi:MAG: anthranilate synthase component I, partial [Acidobacteriota bacterium]
LLLMSVVDLRGDSSSRREAYRMASKRLDNLAVRLDAPEAVPQILETSSDLGDAVPTAPEGRFLEEVRRAKELIAAGEIFQVVLSRRF